MKLGQPLRDGEGLQGFRANDVSVDGQFCTFDPSRRLQLASKKHWTAVVQLRKVISTPQLRTSKILGLSGFYFATGVITHGCLNVLQLAVVMSYRQQRRTNSSARSIVPSPKCTTAPSRARIGKRYTRAGGTTLLAAVDRPTGT